MVQMCRVTPFVYIVVYNIKLWNSIYSQVHSIGLLFQRNSLGASKYLSKTTEIHCILIDFNLLSCKSNIRNVLQMYSNVLGSMNPMLHVGTIKYWTADNCEKFAGWRERVIFVYWPLSATIFNMEISLLPKIALKLKSGGTKSISNSINVFRSGCRKPWFIWWTVVLKNDMIVNDLNAPASPAVNFNGVHNSNVKSFNCEKTLDANASFSTTDILHFLNSKLLNGSMPPYQFACNVVLGNCISWKQTLFSELYELRGRSWNENKR